MLVALGERMSSKSCLGVTYIELFIAGTQKISAATLPWYDFQVKETRILRATRKTFPRFWIMDLRDPESN